MEFNFICSTNLGTYNRDVAKLFGANAAVYLSELIDIYVKASKQNKIKEINGDKYITINRKYIQDQFWISSEEQHNIDKVFHAFKIIHILDSDFDVITLYTDRILNLKYDKDLAKEIKKERKVLVNEPVDRHYGLRMGARDAVKTENEELREAYYRWIDSVLTRYNMITPETVVLNEQLLDNFSNRNLDLALKIINDTTLKGYNKFEYAINNYIKNNPNFAVQKGKERAVKHDVYKGKVIY